MDERNQAGSRDCDDWKCMLSVGAGGVEVKADEQRMG